MLQQPAVYRSSRQWRMKHTLLVNAAQDVERVVGEEPAGVQHVGQHLAGCGQGHVLLVILLILDEPHAQCLVERHHICLHARRRQHDFIRPDMGRAKWRRPLPAHAVAQRQSTQIMVSSRNQDS